MRYLSAIGFICLVLLLAASVASADAFSIVYPIIWSQRPNLDDSPQFDYSSTAHQETLVANDWLCNQPGAVYEVHWWGSLLGAEIPQPDGFFIDQWTHTGSTPWSEPDAEIYTSYRTDYQVAKVPGLDIWEYYIEDWGAWQTGTAQDPEMYFISIQAVYDDPQENYEWGWHEATDALLDYSVMDYMGGGWEHIEHTESEYADVAFELSSPKPEPATLSLLVTGLAALGLRFRRKKKS